ncbi:hypothetical protein EQV77_13650 [Halobacillus fulvus]|nr:hypothetical protein EQV77_13650 [Halobacillus fulvus]
MNKRTFLMLAIAFSAVTFILNHILQTAIGGFFMTLSFLAFAVAILGSVYYIIKFYFKQFNYNRNHRKEIE